ncbi:MAG: SDR family oxidoreductase [Spirochaetota bacterium]|nr:MAG: SDR family oxidoreductase [Spirochaetota bacterium]
MSNEEHRVDGKVAIVTGASRGIGKAIALTLAEAGSDITVIARTEAQLEKTAKEIRKLGRRALSIPMDVSKEEQVQSAVKQTVSEFGKIDILSHNAGILMFKPVAVIPGAKFPGMEAAEDDVKAQTLAEWQQIIDVNLTSAFLLTQAVGPYMLQQKKGKVIIMSSNGAEQGQSLQTAYNSSKAALCTFVRCLASEWGPYNINVNAISPGVINTEMVAPLIADPSIMKDILDATPLGRVGEPREVALLALFLASEASDYITGQTITIDGGTIGRGPSV